MGVFFTLELPDSGNKERSTDLKQIFVRTSTKEEACKWAEYHSPVMIHVPHSSTLVPKEDMKNFIGDELEGELLRMTDHYCDDLFKCKHDMLVFPYSRLVCDVERFKDDKDEPMAAIGMGFAYTHGSNHQKIRGLTSEDKLGIEVCYYDRHHKKLEHMVRRKLLEHDKCLIIDGHSFPGVPLPYEKDDRSERPDICVGTDDYHTDKDLAAITSRFFEKKGYNVAFNDPFSGSIVPIRYYQKDPRMQSIMIEVNRNRYIDADACKKSGYAKIKSDLEDYIDQIGQWFTKSNK